jgi:hypothetical protein
VANPDYADEINLRYAANNLWIEEQQKAGRKNQPAFTLPHRGLLRR